MKKIISLLLIAIVSLIYVSCNNARYLDLRTGEKVELEKDPVTGLMVDAETKKPVYIYVDRETDDTIFGSTGVVINGKVHKDGDGYWYYDGDTKVKNEDGDYKMKSGDYKEKVSEDGDVKIKDGDKKIKIDGKTEEKKVKND